MLNSPSTSAIIITTVTALWLQAVEEIQDFSSNHRQCLQDYKEKDRHFNSLVDFLPSLRRKSMWNHANPQFTAKYTLVTRRTLVLYTLWHTQLTSHMSFYLRTSPLTPILENRISGFRKQFWSLWRLRLVLFQNRLKCPPKKKTQIEELYVLTFVGEKKCL